MGTIKPLLDRFKHHLESSGMISPASRGLLAVSGGTDSVVMTDLFFSVSEALELRLGIVHFNHKTRGSESDEDELFVSDLARSYGLPFYCDSLKTQAAESKESWEAYARRHRYAYIEAVRKSEGYDWTATAHHADDQVETVLLRVIEGTGLSGLRGIWPKAEFIRRPMLIFTREEILEYANDRRLGYREDSSNKDLAHRRNYLRHEVIPAMKSLNPSLAVSIARLVDNATEAETALYEIARGLRERAVSGSTSDGFVLDLVRLNSVPTLIQKLLVFELVDTHRKCPHWRHNTWLELERFLRRASVGNILYLPNGWFLLRDRNRLLLQKLDRRKRPSMEEVCLSSTPPVDVKVDGHTFTMNFPEGSVEHTTDPCVEYVDYDCLKGRDLTIRRWRHGDRMKPLGMTGFKKVSDILIDRKVDLWSKESLFVLTANQEIVWLCGAQLDDRFKVSGTTERVVRLSWQ